jgi:ribosomal protein S18 acetylase RimI-like enzyme
VTADRPHSVRPVLPPPIRRATESDVPAITRALARAFHDDPVMKWFFQKVESRPRYARRFFAGRAKLLLPQREVYTVDGGAAAAMWARPGEWRDPPLAAIRELAALTGGVGWHAPRAMRGLIAVESRHPKPPHWYLAVLGTDPDRQGEGIGSALMQPVLDECDRLEIPAYLETGTEQNVGFYTRHGFRVTGEVPLPKGPCMWLMWREPRA